MLKLRVVVNESDIYELKEKQPLVITGKPPFTRMVVTNGFHSSRPVKINYREGYRLYEVESAVDNVQLLTGLFMSMLFFFIYIFSGLRFFMLFANIPILIMLYLIYMKRHDFIRIYPINPKKNRL